MCTMRCEDEQRNADDTVRNHTTTYQKDVNTSKGTCTYLKVYGINYCVVVSMSQSPVRGNANNVPSVNIAIFGFTTRKSLTAKVEKSLVFQAGGIVQFVILTKTRPRSINSGGTMSILNVLCVPRSCEIIALL